MEIHDILARKVNGRKSREEMAIYESVGNAVEDIVNGYSVYLESKWRSLGIDVGEFLEKKFIV